MIIPNLCCSIRIEPGAMHCVSVVVPHPSYLPEKSWKRMDDPEGMVVVDSHTVDLMRKYGYFLRRRGDVIISVEIDCAENELRDHMMTISEQIPETKETKETEPEEPETKETETKETKVESMLESLDINDIIKVN
jgi:hypothetical protein